MSPSPGSGRTRARRHTVIEVIVLSTLWLAFSGKFDALHLSYGVFSVALVAWVTRDLMVSRQSDDDNRFLSRVHWPTAFAYPFWLLWQILVANIEVAKLVLSPRMAIDPVLVQLDTAMTGAIAHVALGNSITLTPGTITLEADRGRFVVHALHRDSSNGLQPMERRVSRSFGESLDGPHRLEFLDAGEGTGRA